jgi:hypothetical protein
MWARTDRFQADWDLRNMQAAVASARKALWDAIDLGAEPGVVHAMKADLERVQLRQAEAEREVCRVEANLFARACPRRDADAVQMDEKLRRMA